jgi:hypothetical protein
MKKINLVEILAKHRALWGRNDPPYSNASDADEYRIEAMREACNKTIQMCTENARLSESIRGNRFIDDESILKTKDQIE